MKLKSNKPLDILVDIMLVTAIFEKIQYSVFNIFEYISFLFIVCMIMACVQNKMVVRDERIKTLIISQVAFWGIYICQAILIVCDGRAALFDQFYKGIITTGIIRMMVYVCAIIYFTVYNSYSLDKILNKLCAIGSINIIYNIVQYFNRYIDDTVFIRFLHSSVSRYGTDAYGAGVGRLTGLFTDSNNNAAFLIIYFMIVYILIKGASGKKRTLLYLLFGVTALELVLTYSRTGWLGIAACILFIFAKEGLFKNVKLMILIAVGAFAAYYAFNNSFVFHQVMTARLNGLDANNSHLEAARNVLGIIDQSPIYYLIGVGINCLSVHYEAMYGRVGMKAHSLYLQVLCENGIIGLILLLVFWGTIFIMSIKASKSEHKYFGLPIMVIGFLIINLTYDSAFQPLYFWVLAITMVAYRDKYLDLVDIMPAQSRKTMW